jgi:glyoxylase-like metal-dependent hydrolase (beta-lactamase superfamily II)
MFFKQIKYRGDNFSYIIADEKTHEAAVVDPSFNMDAITMLLREKKMNVKFVINTHGHSDHTAGNEDIRKAFNTKIVAHRNSHIEKDDSVEDGDVLKVGEIAIKVLHTPGHSPDGICLLFNDKVLTGDTLFIGECGRTDLPGGNAEEMYHSLFDKLMILADGIEVYPGHDYGPKPHSTIGEERMSNYTLQRRTLREFMEFMGLP